MNRKLFLLLSCLSVGSAGIVLGAQKSAKDSCNRLLVFLEENKGLTENRHRRFLGKSFALLAKKQGTATLRNIQAQAEEMLEDLHYKALFREADKAILLSHKTPELDSIRQDHYKSIGYINGLVKKNIEEDKRLDERFHKRHSMAESLSQRKRREEKVAYDKMMVQLKKDIKRAKTREELYGDAILGSLKNIYDKAKAGHIPMSKKPY